MRTDFLLALRFRHGGIPAMMQPNRFHVSHADERQMKGSFRMRRPSRQINRATSACQMSRRRIGQRSDAYSNEPLFSDGNRIPTTSRCKRCFLIMNPIPRHALSVTEAIPGGNLAMRNAYVIPGSSFQGDTRYFHARRRLRTRRE